MRIVIVEDEAPIREGMEGILKKLDDSYEVVGKAADGLEGLEVIRRENPDVILMDIRMPGMDGLDMLRKLRNEGNHSKAVVLSAYSDFSFAKEAMELGVDNYILKPVRLHELRRVLAETGEAVREEKRTDSLLSLENITRSSLSGMSAQRKAEEEALEKRYGILPGEHLGLLEVWLGETFDGRRDITMRILSEPAEHALDYRGIVTAFPERQICVMVLYHMEKEKNWEEYLNSSLLPMLLANTDNRAVCVWGECEGFGGLEECSGQLRQLLDWNLPLGNGRILSRSLVEKTQTYPLKYPPELSVRVKQAVIKKDRKEFQSCFSEFVNLSRQQVHQPREIKESCITFLWTVLNTAREYITFQEDGPRVQSFLEELTRAVTWEEIGSCLEKIFRAVDQDGFSRTQELSPLVRRARHMIEEYYSQGITMEEVARSLSVTPEYLSRQYKKETGLSFTGEIRRIRVEKVKTLLLGTDLNLTQIAAITGFTDPKYMSKVFKEEVGMLPAEYRKMNG